MTDMMPVQKFQLGDRVKPKEDLSFVIADIRMQGGRIEYSGFNRGWYLSDDLILAPERPPYVPSERRVLGRAVTIARYQPELYRCETDAELVARHVIERAEYNAQGDGV